MQKIQYMVKRVLFFLCCMFSGAFVIPAFALSKDTTAIDYRPKIQGTIRAKYEYNTSDDLHRFQIRNARLNVNGNICRFISYKAEVDLSDEGVMKMLDAFIRYTPLENWDITIGQQKVPFSTENLRSPHLYYFANRSFIAKQMSHDVRDVGLMMRYSYTKKFPFSISAGLYNGSGLYDQKEWQNNFNIAARVVFNPLDDFEFSLSMNSVKPDAIRMNLFDASVNWTLDRFHAEAEYVYKIYEKKAFKDTQAAMVFACYHIPTPKWKALKKISPVLRYDFMTDNHKTSVDDAGNCLVDDYGRQRITGGFIFSLGTPFLSDIRLNYEQYFYNNGIENHDNKLVVECVVRF